MKLGFNNKKLPFSLFGWINCTVNTANQWIFDNILNNVHVETDADFSQIEKITHTGALLIGTYDSFTYGNPTCFLENINNHFKNPDSNELIFIEKTGYTYQNKEEELAECLVDLIKKWSLQ